MAALAPRSGGRTDAIPTISSCWRATTRYRNLIKLVSTSHSRLLLQAAHRSSCSRRTLRADLPLGVSRWRAAPGDPCATWQPPRRWLASMPRSLARQLLSRAPGPRIPRRHGRAGLVEIARRTGLPLVATNDHTTSSRGRRGHDILLCLQTGARREEEKRFRFSGPEYYSRARSRCATVRCIWRGVSNTVAIANRCHVEIPLGQNLLPRTRRSQGARRRHVPSRALRGGCPGALCGCGHDECASV